MQGASGLLDPTVASKGIPSPVVRNVRALPPSEFFGEVDELGRKPDVKNNNY